MIHKALLSTLTALSTAALLAFSAATSAELEMSVKSDGMRATAKQITAVITDIDQESREVTLQGPLGNTFTLQVGDAVERLNEFEKGDMVLAQYESSLSGELREPTEAEMAMPWVELDAASVNEAGFEPGAAVGKAIRAVVSIEGMNRITRTVTVLDAKGDFHIIGDVNPEKMEGVVLGDKLILVYTQAVALELEKHTPAQ